LSYHIRRGLSNDFFEIFLIALSNGAASSATGIILPYCLSCVNRFLYVFLIGRLTGTACPPQAKKISRSVLCDDGKHASQSRLVIEMSV
uniref:hypothetical protein n=1 Tax=Dialister sp. TaxID=1955814 RepID=UPI004027F3AF